MMDAAHSLIQHVFVEAASVPCPVLGSVQRLALAIQRAQLGLRRRQAARSRWEDRKRVQYWACVPRFGQGAGKPPRVTLPGGCACRAAPVPGLGQTTGWRGSWNPEGSQRGSFEGSRGLWEGRGSREAPRTPYPTCSLLPPAWGVGAVGEWKVPSTAGPKGYKREGSLPEEEDIGFEIGFELSQGLQEVWENARSGEASVLGPARNSKRNTYRGRMAHGVGVAHVRNGQDAARRRPRAERSL